jgi:D-alanyl-D-alanine carboxypeptidase/D-alanyl-D-alanine-endopeptidase (penicillin-binding protein 4)
MNKRWFIVVLFLLVAHTNGIGQAVEKSLNSIDKAVQQLVQDAQMQNASLSFYVYDVDTKKVVSEHQPKTSLVTASTMKVVTTATALELMGSYHKFETKIQYDGTLNSSTGVLKGNVYIKGGGDPTLGSKYYTADTVDIMQSWVKALHEAGIKKIEGRVIGDASYFGDEYVPPTWGWIDMGNYYGAGVSGLTIYDNILKVWFDVGDNVNDSSTVTCYEPYSPDIFIDNRVRAGAITGDEAYMYGAPYEGYRLIKGRLPKGAKDFEIRGAIHEPDYVAAYEFQHKIIQSGIAISGQATTIRRLQLHGAVPMSKRTDVLSISSPALSSIVYWTNLISNNLFAEHLLKHIGMHQYKDPSVYSSTLAIEKYWRSKGVEMTGFYMNDGSGLSRANAISAQHLTEILVQMRNSKFWGSFESSLPVAAKTGTLKNIGKGTKIQGNLKAKSGTMTRVKSYAGYVKCASGEQLAFAVIANNFNCSTAEMAKKLERLMIALGNYSSN